ncbi:MAG: putative small lipoprotein YifL [Paraglaciecola sp.]|jgi:predicted small lipoprotein YifL
MFLSVIGVSGCGQKRPLYLPEVPAENKLPTATSEQTQSHSSKEQS